MNEYLNNEKKTEEVMLFSTHVACFILGMCSVLIYNLKCSEDHSRDKVLCKTTQYAAVVRGEEITYQPRETDTIIKQKWTCVSEWADNHSLKDSDKVYIKAEILKNIESGPK